MILGRGASFLLPPERRVALLFVAPLEVRIQNVMKDLGLSEKQAREHIVKVEAEHRRFAKKCFQADLLRFCSLPHGHQYGFRQTGYHCRNHERNEALLTRSWKEFEQARKG